MKLKQKMIAVILIIMLMWTYLLTLGNAVIAVTQDLSTQTSKTNNENVEFNSYFGEEQYSKTFEMGEEAKLYLKIKVSNTGYLKSGIVQFASSNFEVDTKNLKSDMVQSCSKTEIKLKQINNSNNEVIIEVPITMVTGETVDSDLFDKITTVKFTGTYMDENGKEKSIEKEISNEAKWKGTAEAELAGQVTKYIPYEIGEEKGVLVQAKVRSELKDNSLPVAKTKIEADIPEIKISADKAVSPERVTVVANTTKATNGKGSYEFNEENYKYNEETNKIEIEVTNNEENGKISWSKNAVDEYMINYIYTGEEVYSYVQEQLEKAKETVKTEEEKEKGQVNENAITGKINIKSTIEAYNSEETILEKEGTINYTIEEKLGDMVDFSMSNAKTISKGYIYANYAKQEAKKTSEGTETTYYLNYKAQIYDVSLNNGIELKTAQEKLIGEDEYSSGNNIITKQITISENIFNKMLGEEGKIEVSDSKGKLLGEINTSTKKDEEGNYTLDISEKNVNEVIIKTSKPVTEGTLQVKVQKAFVTKQTYTKTKMESFEKMTVETTAKANTNNKTLKAEISLTEPVSKAEISIEEGKENLSTVVENKDVDIRVVLDTSSVENALYQDPVIEIQMPKQVKKVEINDANLLLDDELKIKQTKVISQNNKQIIQITLEGTQTEYFNTNVKTQENVITKGANIILNTNITVDTLSPSKTENIVMYYINGNTDKYETTYKANANSTDSEEIGTAETEVNIVAPSGMITANGLSNYAKNAQDILSISDEVTNATIETYADKQIATVIGKVINNYENKITDLVILGRIPAKDNKKIDSDESLGSTFDTKLNSEIKLTGINAENYTIYYSDKADATKDLTNTANDWSTSTENAKSYMIVTKDYEMQAGEEIDFTYNIEIPANLNYNNSSYEMYKMYYNNVSSVGTMSETKVSPILGITTGTGPELSVELSSTVDTIREGQIVKMKVKVTNSGTEDATNVKVTIPLPENCTFVEHLQGIGFAEKDDVTQTINIETIKVEESVEKTYYLKIDENIADSELPKEITNKVTVSADAISEEITSNELKLNIQKADMCLELVSNSTESYTLRSGDKIRLIVNAKEISDASLEDINIVIPLADGIKCYAIYVQDEETEVPPEAVDGNVIELNIPEGVTIENNNITVHLQSLDKTKVIYIDLEAESINTDLNLIAYAYSNNTEIACSNDFTYSIGKYELNVNLASEPEVIKEKETLTYTVTIKNTGSTYINSILIKNTIPKELTINKVYYKLGEEEIGENGRNDNEFEKTYFESEDIEISIPYLEIGKEIQVTIDCTANLLEDENDKEVQNYVTVSAYGIDDITSNTVTNIIEYDKELHKKDNEPEDPTTDPSTDPSEDPTTDPTESRYKITGTAWLDSDKNGQRDTEEEILPNIQVILLEKATNSIVKDPDTSEQKITTTGEDGKYEFNNLPEGEYLVIFLYDTSKYSLTTYQAKDVSESSNSDAINMKITLNGEQRYVGVTDAIKITDRNARNIDIGLYVAEKFDLRLDKYISKITITTPTSGTKVYNYENSKLTKREVYGKDVNSSSIVVEYKIVVTNEGQVSGYAKKLVDYLPEDAKFSSELNNDWYLANNSTEVYNTSLENEKIEPGESKEVTLILSISITDKNIGTMINNNAEIYESYNEQGLQDIDSIEGNKITDEDDMSSADIMISIATGKIVIYTTLIIAIIVIIVIGVYEIRKRVLKQKKV